MKMKRWLLALAVIGTLEMCSTRSEAATAWYTCDITMLGQGWGNIYVQLRDTGGAFTDQWTVAPADTTQANRLLACVLTAMNAGFQVMVAIDRSSAAYPQIQAFYVIP